MRIGELASRVNVNTKTIRYYESIGLMPEPARKPSGYRDYNLDAVERLQFIRDSQATGLSLAAIQSILDLKDSDGRTCEYTRALLSQHVADLDARIQHLQEARSQLVQVADRAARTSRPVATR